MPKPTGIAETVLYVDDLPRAVDFYVRLLDVSSLQSNDRFCALRVGPGQVLLLFRRGASRAPAAVPGGTVPAHDGSGPLHVCFGMARTHLTPWMEKLREMDTPLESRVDWPGGAVSLYFRDPDGHAIELATPGIWNRQLKPPMAPMPRMPKDRHRANSPPHG